MTNLGQLCHPCQILLDNDDIYFLAFQVIFASCFYPFFPLVNICWHTLKLHLVFQGAYLEVWPEIDYKTLEMTLFSWWLEDIIVGREKPVAKLFLKQMTPKILWGWINICGSWNSISDCCITYMRIAIWSESRLLQNYSVYNTRAHMTGRCDEVWRHWGTLHLHSNLQPSSQDNEFPVGDITVSRS